MMGTDSATARPTLRAFSMSDRLTFSAAPAVACGLLQLEQLMDVADVVETANSASRPLRSVCWVCLSADRPE